jgi:hypothetical protein
LLLCLLWLLLLLLLLLLLQPICRIGSDCDLSAAAAGAGKLFYAALCGCSSKSSSKSSSRGGRT